MYLSICPFINRSCGKRKKEKEQEEEEEEEKKKKNKKIKTTPVGIL